MAARPAVPPLEPLPAKVGLLILRSAFYCCSLFVVVVAFVRHRNAVLACGPSTYKYGNLFDCLLACVVWRFMDHDSTGLPDSTGFGGSPVQQCSKRPMRSHAFGTARTCGKLNGLLPKDGDPKRSTWQCRARCGLPCLRACFVCVLRRALLNACTHPPVCVRCVTE